MKRILTLIAVLTVAIVAVSLSYFISSSRHPGHIDARKIIVAAKTYADTLKSQGLPVPAAVPLQDLIAKRLLTDADVSGFAGIDVTISLSVDETRPDVVMRARLPSGDELVALADGGVRQVPRKTK